MDKATYTQRYIQKKIAYKDMQGLQYLLKNKNGRWFISRLFDYCRIYKPLPRQQHKMLIAEGSRRIALITYQALQKMPEQQRLLDLREQEFTDCPWSLKVFTRYKDRQAIKYLLAGENGRWYLNRLLESCQMGGQSFLEDEKINTIFIFEGKRKVATWLYKMLCRYGIKNWQIAKAEHHDWLAQVKLLAADDAEKNANEEYYD